MSAAAPPQALLEAIGRLQEMAAAWLRLFPQSAAQGEHWLKVLRQVAAHLAEDTCRLAVVGAVKSGKSTLINALVGRDLLKRGAGILTAMVTRVQAGPELEAVLTFKDWPQIQAEIQRALDMLQLPGPSQRRPASLDLRQPQDREVLAQTLAQTQAQSQELWCNGNLDANFLLLQSYLEGYDLLGRVMPESGPLALTGADMQQHRDLVTREASAVYLKDVLLTAPLSWAERGVELGDCQGSDSPIPQHLTQVLAYLLRGDAALYVVSSRVGLRQADFQFLGELRRMGLADHILTVLNLDLGEHGSLAEVMRQRDRLRQELAAWQAEPRVYAFSGLKLLLKRRLARGEALEPRELGLLAVWAVDADLAAFSDDEAVRFQADLENDLAQWRQRRMSGSSRAQVRLVAQGLKDQMELTLKLLSGDLKALQDMETRLASRRRSLEGAMASLRQTLAGAGQRLKQHLKRQTESQLDRQRGPAAAALNQFIQAYQPPWEQLLPTAAAGGLRAALHQLFQDFSRELGQFAASQLNLGLVEFIHAQEDWLRRELQELWEPLELSFQEAVNLYYRELADLGLAGAAPSLAAPLPEKPQELAPPLLLLEIAGGVHQAQKVWLRTGLGWLGGAWQALKRRLKLGRALTPEEQLRRDLAGTLVSLKAWLCEEARNQLLDYQERLKFQYFFPLTDQWLKAQESGMENALNSLCGSLSGMAGAMQQEEAQRAAGCRLIQELLPQVRQVEAALVVSS
jgi:hypothetical protein